MGFVHHVRREPQQPDELPRVGVVRNGRVELASVQIGHDYGAKVEIISGLASADQVILNPPDSLAQGEQVNVEKGDAE